MNEIVTEVEYNILNNAGILFIDKVIKLFSCELIKLHVICRENTEIDHIAIYYRKRNSDNSKWHFGCLFYPDDFIGRDRYLIKRLRTMDPKYNAYIELYDMLENRIDI